MRVQKEFSFLIKVSKLLFLATFFLSLIQLAIIHPIFISLHLTQTIQYTLYLIIFKESITNLFLIVFFYVPPLFFNKNFKNYLKTLIVWSLSLSVINQIMTVIDFSNLIVGGINFFTIFGKYGFWKGIGGVSLYFIPIAFLFFISCDTTKNKKITYSLNISILSIPLIYFLLSIFAGILLYFGKNLYVNQLIFWFMISITILVGILILFLSKKQVFPTYDYSNSISMDKKMRFLILAFILNFVFDIVVVLFLTIPEYSVMEPDSYQYLSISQDFASGDFLIPSYESMPHRGILYPLLFSPFLLLPGKLCIKAAFFSVFITSLFVVSVIDLAWLLKGKKVALLTGILIIFHPFTWIFSFLLLSDMISLLFIVLSIKMLIKINMKKQNHKVYHFIILGIYVGLSILARFQNYILLTVPIILFLFYKFFKTKSQKYYKFILFLIIFLTTVFIFSFPIFFYHNYYYGDPFFSGQSSNFLWADSYEEAHNASVQLSFSTFWEKHGLSGISSRLFNGFQLVLKTTENRLGISNIFGGVILFLSILSMILLPIMLNRFKGKISERNELIILLFFSIHFIFAIWLIPNSVARVTILPIFWVLIITMAIILIAIYNKRLPDKNIRFKKITLNSGKIKFSILISIVILALVAENYTAFLNLQYTKNKNKDYIEGIDFISTNYEIENLNIAYDIYTSNNLMDFDVEFNSVVILEHCSNIQNVDQYNQTEIELSFIVVELKLLILRNPSDSPHSKIQQIDLFLQIYSNEVYVCLINYILVFSRDTFKIFLLSYNYD